MTKPKGDLIYEICAKEIQKQIGALKPELAMILGSGLNNLANEIEDAVIMPYAILPGFTATRVSGHAGNLVCGRLGGIPVICMQGRSHIYEGHQPSTLLNPIRALKTLGVKVLLQTNAAGSMHTDWPPGTLMAINDHINLSSFNPLIGPNDDAIGPRFFDMSRAYDPDLNKLLDASAAKAGIRLKHGVYSYFPGPNFETPAEIRAMKTLGTDAVGMSTVHETLIAAHAGIKNIAVSCLTNLAAGLSPTALSHAETVEQSGKAADSMAKLIKQFIADAAEQGEIHG